jgi:predicted nucleic acid-binding protein
VGVQSARQYALFSAIAVLELETGVLLVQRRDPKQDALLRAWLDQHVLPAISGRVLPVDTAVVQRCAALHVPDPRSERDALIAATAMVHHMTVATRNADDFAATGAPLLNPWDAAARPGARGAR